MGGDEARSADLTARCRRLGTRACGIRRTTRGVATRVLDGVQNHECCIFFASEETESARETGRITRTPLPKLSTQPTSSRLSATVRVMITPPFFSIVIFCVGCHMRSLTQAAVALSNRKPDRKSVV